VGVEVASEGSIDTDVRRLWEYLSPIPESEVVFLVTAGLMVLLALKGSARSRARSVRSAHLGERMREGKARVRRDDREREKLVAGVGAGDTLSRNTTITMENNGTAWHTNYV
jgi:hypothetical protein